MLKKSLNGRRISPIVSAVVIPVAKRLSRIEALLTEMRFEQDVQLKRVARMGVRLDSLTENRVRRIKH